MSVSSLGGLSGLISSIVSGRETMLELSRQLSTNKRVTTYAHLPNDVRLDVLGFRSEISEIKSYQSNIRDTVLYLDIAEKPLLRAQKIAEDIKSGAVSAPFSLIDGRYTAFQHEVKSAFGEMVGLLNGEINGRYLFSGRKSNVKPVQNSEQLFDGDGKRAGLKQLIHERSAADRGVDGLGRLMIKRSAIGDVSLSEEASDMLFGFRVADMKGQLNSVLTDESSVTSESPRTLTVSFREASISPGQSIDILLNLPDGTQETVRIKASDSLSREPNEFFISESAEETASSFELVLRSEISKLVDTSLAAASAITASGDFFSGSSSNPPRRIEGPFFEKAMGFVAGTDDNTIIWYQGDDMSSPPRESAMVQVDDQVVIAYGARADEPPIRHMMQFLGALSVEGYKNSEPNAKERYKAFNERVARAFSFPSDIQDVRDIITELGLARKRLDETEIRHQASRHFFEDFLSKKEDISLEEVSTKLLAMKNQLFAIMEATSLIAQMSLVNFMR
ncbi:MAG: hypothetical protein PSN37_06130 [Alphaproteobacteria bacterium]|nr:hypothetical protein [Alphaproteobacteria bacterium]